MLHEIRELGLECAELSHGIRISLLPGIFEAVDAGEIKISTLHNFCPLPIGIDYAAPNIYQFTSLQARERDMAWRHTIKTLDTAARLGAKGVVLHCGSIEIKDYSEKLTHMVTKGLKESPKYQKLCEEVQIKLEQKKEKHLEFLYETLRKLAGEAQQRNLTLCIENREALEELPLDSDFHFFFKELDHPHIRYWHDTGHAQIKEILGFLHHTTHVAGLADRLFGFHIHDVHLPDKDHRQPGTGVVPFAELKQFVKPHHLKVFEFSPSLTPEQARDGIAFVRACWGSA